MQIDTLQQFTTLLQVFYGVWIILSLTVTLKTDLLVDSLFLAFTYLQAVSPRGTNSGKKSRSD